MVHLGGQEQAADRKLAGFLNRVVPMPDCCEVAVKYSDSHKDRLVAVPAVLTKPEHLLHSVRSLVLCYKFRFSGKFDEALITDEFAAFLSFQICLESIIG